MERGKEIGRTEENKKRMEEKERKEWREGGKINNTNDATHRN